MKELIAYVDGGCNNKTKSGGYGSFAVFGKDELVRSETFILPAKTSNQAEYMSLIKLLEYITYYQKSKGNRKHNWTIYSDSKLTVNQVTNGWKVSEPTLRLLNREAKSLLHKLRNTSIIWVGRKNIVEVLGH